MLFIVWVHDKLHLIFDWLVAKLYEDADKDTKWLFYETTKDRGWFKKRKNK